MKTDIKILLQLKEMMEETSNLVDRTYLDRLYKRRYSKLLKKLGEKIKIDTPSKSESI